MPCWELSIAVRAKSRTEARGHNILKNGKVIMTLWKVITPGPVRKVETWKKLLFPESLKTNRGRGALPKTLNRRLRKQII
jgi:hypothetical protein